MSEPAIASIQEIVITVPTGEPWDIDVQVGSEPNSIVASVTVPAVSYVFRIGDNPSKALE